MKFLSGALRMCLDFLFPNSEKTMSLESLAPRDLLHNLPLAKDTEANIIALFDYGYPLTKELIWELKYNGNNVIAKKMGQILFDVIQTELSERSLFEKFNHPILMPIPISDKKRMERGWNQTEKLCGAIKSYDTEGLLKYMPRQLVK